MELKARQVKERLIEPLQVCNCIPLVVLDIQNSLKDFFPPTPLIK